jgi:DNA-binding transcriptional LysR family regulator
MHPRLLTTFLAVARTRSVTRAAEAVHLAQSSVSDQIQALEAELGATLFIRSKAGLELTPAGLALKPAAEASLTCMKAASWRSTLRRPIRYYRHGHASPSA